MSGEESSNNNDWALVTQDGDVCDESEDEVSYSGSSIELLSSDDEVDNSNRGSSETTSGEHPGAFFVLRLRSKDLLTESDSDDKEDVFNKLVSSSKTDKSELKSQSPVNRNILVNKKSNITKEESDEVIPSSQIEHGEIDKGNGLDSSTVNGAVYVKEDGNSLLSSVPVKNTFETRMPDNISFPSSSAGSTTSEPSIPEVLQLEVSDDSQTETQHISLQSDEVHGHSAEKVPLSHNNEQTEIQDNGSSSSMTSSNFSLVDQDELEEDGGNSLISNTLPDMEDFSIVDEDDTITSQNMEDSNLSFAAGNENERQIRDTENPTTVFQQPKPKVSYLATGLLEGICFIIVGFSCFCVGYIQNAGLAYDDFHEAIKMEDLTIQGKFDNLLQKYIHVTETGVNRPRAGKINDDESGFEFRILGDLNVKVESFEHDLIEHAKEVHFKHDHERKSYKQEMSYLKSQLDKVKNEKADLHREFTEQGKRKYLLKELEDENFALFKRIGDLENQLTETQDQSYAFQVQISSLEKKSASRLSDKKNLANTLQIKISQLEEEKFKLDKDAVVLENKIIQLEDENKKMDNYALEIDSCRQEMMEIMSGRGQLAVEVDDLKRELKSVGDQRSDLEQKVKKLQEELKKSATRSNANDQNQKRSNVNTDSDEDEGIDVTSFDEYDSNEQTKQTTTEYPDNDQTEKKTEEYPKSSQQKTGKKKFKKSEKSKDKKFSDDEHQSWSDAMNDILNKTRSSMANVNQQIQDTLSQVKNLSEELWKKHEPSVNRILSSTYEKVKENVHHVTNKVAKAAEKIVQKSSKWINKYKKNIDKRNRRNRKHNEDRDEHTAKSSTSRRGKHSDHDIKDADDDSKTNNYPGYLKNELQSLRDSVGYVNTLKDFKCVDLIDIMEDFQNFKKSEGVNILTSQEKSWFYCQKGWFENMAYSDPSVEVECRNFIVRRQQAAVDHGCCPCFGQYGRSKGKFCNFENGCGKIHPKERIKKNKNTGKKNGDKTEEEKNKTKEEETDKNHGHFIYCDPFSQDLDCGDESWYLKRMKDREHLRKYRTSSKSAWLFERAEERDYQRTQPDDWFFNRAGGQSYEAHQDDNWYRHEDENYIDPDWV